MTAARENQAPLKVLGVGLGRTGTLSLCTALQILGFGPCHHPHRIGLTKMDQWRKFAKAANGEASPEILDDLYHGYVSAMDNTTAILAKPLYKAYPDAKFILTVRDPTKWAGSMRKTVLKSVNEHPEREWRIGSGMASEEDRALSDWIKKSGILEWGRVYHLEYHRGRLKTDPEGELLRHNQSIIQLIPPEKLLVFDIAEGWGPLVRFLGVPEPSVPFPHLNSSERFEERGKELRQKVSDHDDTQ